MRRLVNKWGIAVVLAANYLLAITTTALFHNHSGHNGGGCGEHSPSHAIAHDDDRSHTPAPVQCPSDDAKCPACQFLAQHSTPIGDSASIVRYALVQEISPVAPARSVDGAFSAWQSRAPPVIA
jgi:hypothetical protein